MPVFARKFWFGMLMAMTLSGCQAGAQPESAAPRLAGLLDADIKAGLVQVSDLADRSVVTIKGDGTRELYDASGTREYHFTKALR